MAKRKRRRALAIFGSAPKEHRTRAQAFYQGAVDAHQRAKEAQTCGEALANLCEAMRKGDLAANNLHSVGASAGRGRSSKRKFADALDRLRKQVVKDYRSASQRCVRKYPEA